MKFLAALQFLTVIPLPRRLRISPEAAGGSAGYFPAVGIILGLILAGLNWLLGLVLPPALVNVLLVASLAGLTGAPDFLGALKSLGEHYFVHDPAYKRKMCVEIGLESTRNPRVGEIFREVDVFITSSFERLFQRMKDEGRIAPDLDIPTLTQVFSVIADGLFWRRAVDPNFDGNTLVPAALHVIAGLLKPVSDTSQQDTKNNTQE